MQNVRVYQPSVYEESYWDSNGTTSSTSKLSAERRIYFQHSSYYGPRVNKQNPFSYEKIDASGHLVRTEDNVYLNQPYSSHYKTEGGCLVTNMSEPVFSAVLPYDSSYDDALEKFNEKYRGTVDLSIDILEGHQTRKMLSVTNQLVNFTRTASQRFGIAKLAGGAWLQLQYGWRPLLSTIHGLAEESLRASINKSSSIRARKSNSGTIDKVSLFTREGYRDITGVFSYKQSTTIECELATRESFDFGSLTSLNPVSIAWELMPYSFVVDWFYDVGSYLRNMESSLLYGNSFLRGIRSSLTTLEGSGEFLSAYSFNPEWYKNTTRYERLTGDVRWVVFNRSLLSSYPAPRPPKFKADLGSSRLLSAASLLGNFLGRRS